jgi:hypothetical protein
MFPGCRGLVDHLCMQVRGCADIYYVDVIHQSSQVTVNLEPALFCQRAGFIDRFGYTPHQIGVSLSPARSMGSAHKTYTNYPDAHKGSPSGYKGYHPG